MMVEQRRSELPPSILEWARQSILRSSPSIGNADGLKHYSIDNDSLLQPTVTSRECAACVDWHGVN